MKRIQLWDSFNNVLISKHNTLEGAIRKQRKHLKRVKRANGKDAYLTYSFKRVMEHEISEEIINEAKANLDQKLANKGFR